MSKESVITEHIEITPGVLGGKPCIAGHRIAIAHIAEMYLKMGISIEEIAGKYDLPLASVHAAMTYYYDRREEIDRRTAESRAIVEELKTQQSTISVTRKIETD